MGEKPESIDDAEKECMQKTKQEFSDVLQSLTDLNDIFLQFFKHILPQSHKKDLGTHLIVTIIISVRSFRLLQNCIKPITAGYYESGMILIRSIYENNMLLSYLKDKEDVAEKWLVGEKSFTQKFLREKAGMDNTPYKVLSNEFAHPNEVRGTLTSFSLGESTLDMHIFPIFDYDKAHGLYYCLITGFNALDMMRDAFTKENMLSDEIFDVYKKLISDILVVLDTYKSKKKKNDS